MNTKIETIVSEAMKRSAFEQYSLADQAKQDCNGQVECLVNKHANSNKAESEALSLAATFNTLADYDNAIQSIQKIIDQYDEKDAVRDALRQFVNAVDPEDLNNAVYNIMHSTFLEMKKYKLKSLATAHACLTLQWDDAIKQFPNHDIEKYSPDGIIGIQLVSAFNAMKSSGTLEKWIQLSAQESVGDSKLDFIKRTFIPLVK